MMPQLTRCGSACQVGEARAVAASAKAGPIFGGKTGQGHGDLDAAYGDAHTIAPIFKSLSLMVV
jgi:hypothetical protein